MDSKKCSICGEIKNLDDFYRDKRSSDGRASQCKKCSCASSRRWQAANPEKMRAAYKRYHESHREQGRQWYLKNKDRVREKGRKWAAAHPDKLKEYADRYRANHADTVKKAKRTYYLKWYAENFAKVRESNKKWHNDNIEKMREYYRDRMAEQRKTPKGRLSSNVSRGIARSLLDSKGGRHWESLVDFTTDQLKKHIERSFLSGMSWDNYGEWHIDHKIPIAAFNFECPEDIDFRKCWSLENLQPMWAKENMGKGARLSKPFQPALAISINS